MSHITHRSILALGLAGLVLAAIPSAVCARNIPAPVAAAAQAGPTFSFPSNGQSFPLNGPMLFQVQPMGGAKGYLWSFVQGGLVAYQDLAWTGHLDGTTYTLKRGSLTERLLHSGPMQVWVRAWMGGSRWSKTSSLTVQLQGQNPQPAPQSQRPAGSRHPAAGTVLYEADVSNGKLNSWTGTTDWKHLNGMLVDDGSSNQSWIQVPYSVTTTTDYAIEAEMQVVKNLNATLLGLTLRKDDSGRNWYNGQIAFVCCNGWAAEIHYENARTGTDETIGSATIAPSSIGVGTGDWHTYRLEVRGNQLRYLFDGAPLVTVADNRDLSGPIAGLWANGVQVNVRRVALIAL